MFWSGSARVLECFPDVTLSLWTLKVITSSQKAAVSSLTDTTSILKASISVLEESTSSHGHHIITGGHHICVEEECLHSE